MEEQKQTFTAAAANALGLSQGGSGLPLSLPAGPLAALAQALAAASGKPLVMPSSSGSPSTGGTALQPEFPFEAQR